MLSTRDLWDYIAPSILRPSMGLERIFFLKEYDLTGQMVLEI